MKGKRYGELTGAGMILLLFGAQHASADPPAELESGEDPDVLEIPDSSLERAQMIIRQQEWRGIRSIWRELDGMEPGPDGYAFGELDWDQANLMREKVTALGFGITAALETDGVSTREVDMVLAILRMRLDFMSTGLPSMLTRMMPPPIEYNKGDLIEDLEAKIDTLLDLGRSGALSMEQVRVSTESILETAVAISIIDAITLTYGYPYSYDLSLISLQSEVDLLNMADFAINEMERHYALLAAPDSDAPEYYDMNELTERYETTLEVIGEIRGCTTGLNFLLGDLLLGGNS